MSSGLKCDFVEQRPGRWFYLLERHDAPARTWNWHEFVDAYGPFATIDEAETHLLEYHVNPGGWMVFPYDPANPPDADEDEVFAKATLPC